MWGHSVARLIEALHYKSEFGVIRILHLPHYGPGVNSDSNRNEYQEYFLGVKVAGA